MPDRGAMYGASRESSPGDLRHHFDAHSGAAAGRGRRGHVVPLDHEYRLAFGRVHALEQLQKHLMAASAILDQDSRLLGQRANWAARLWLADIRDEVAPTLALARIMLARLRARLIREGECG